MFWLHWLCFEVLLQDLLRSQYADVEKMAIVPLALSDSWVSDIAWDRLQQVVVSEGGQDIVGTWIEAVFSPQVWCDFKAWSSNTHESANPDPPVDEEQGLTLEALHDRLRRQESISKLLPRVVEATLGARSMDRQGKTRDEIKKKFPLLAELEDAELDNIIAKRSVSAYAAATDVISTRCPDLEASFIRKYAQPSYGKRKGWAAGTSS